MAGVGQWDRQTFRPEEEPQQCLCAGGILSLLGYWGSFSSLLVQVPSEVLHIQALRPLCTHKPNFLTS